MAGVPEQSGDGQCESSQGVPGECGERGLVPLGGMHSQQTRGAYL